mgnify:CR=1 FL=1
MSVKLFVVVVVALQNDNAGGHNTNETPTSRFFLFAIF